MAEVILGVLVGVVLTFFLAFKWLWYMGKALVAVKAMLDKVEKEKAEIQWRNDTILATFEAKTIKELKLLEEKRFLENVQNIMNGKQS